VRIIRVLLVRIIRVLLVRIIRVLLVRIQTEVRWLRVLHTALSMDVAC
jgi:hypothetical protein